jgi:hypothetical protein
MLGFSTHAYDSERFSSLDDQASMYDEVTVNEDDVQQTLPARGISKSTNYSKMSLFDEETVVSRPERGMHHMGDMDSRMSLYDDYTVAEESVGEETPLSSQKVAIEEEEATIIHELEEETVSEEDGESLTEIEEQTVMEDYEEVEHDGNEGESDASSSSLGSAAPAGEDNEEEDSGEEEDDEEDGEGFTLDFKRGSGGTNNSRMSDITVDHLVWPREMMDEISDDDEEEEDYVPLAVDDDYCIKFKEGNSRSSIMALASPKRSPPRNSVNRRTPRGINPNGGSNISPLAMVSEGTTEQESGRKKRQEIDVGGPKTELFEFWEKKVSDALAGEEKPK